ncbi:fimbrillin family protein, partial [Alistipes shahii]|uniref:fimbrillin family protein n=1 Tax=Alistipes shahii TaxID=328814 RepID=UPI0034A525CA
SVAVMMDGMVKTYNVTPSTADPTSATLTSTDPYYWTNHNDITVTAWWPYTAGETTPPAVKVKANQSAQKDFEGSDLIVADGQTVTYGSPTLRFTHRTARVTIVLTDYTEGLASVRLTGLSTEGGNPAEITPYDKGSNTYTALVAPQSVAAGTTFITCTFTNGKTFVYKMKNATDWQAGGEYTYTVSLAAAKDLGYTIESNGSYTVYNADGLLNVAKLVNGGKTDINITLDKNIDLTGKGWTPIGTSFDNSYKGTFDGGGHTITGLTVTTNDQFVGLFGYLNRAGTVKNVVMEGIQITSNHMFGCTGGVVGYSWGTIENCSVSGSVSGTDCVGGVVGSQKAGSIIGCCTSATVKGTHYVGGVAGEKWGTMTACYATGNVTLEIASQKNLYGGGVVGLNGGSRVLACYATGNVTSTGSSTGNVHIGGLFGDSYTTVTACYWKNNQERGYKTAPESTKVDGTYVTWQKAVDAMNTALQNAGSEWRYELTGALPTLRKQ